MTGRASCQLLMTLLMAAGLSGCAHRRPDPFVYGPQAIQRVKGDTPDCHTESLADCVGDPSSHPRDLRSPWRYRFHPDLHHNVCHGDLDAQRRFLEGARLQLGGDDKSGTLRRTYLSFLNGCTSAAFCDWALSAAGDSEQPPLTRDLLEEAARRNCGISTQAERCAELDRPEDPWSDLVKSQSAGCLDLEEWLDRHRTERARTVDALLRCVDGSEIRYREANCLRELAGFDRERAVAYVRDYERRGWGISSKVTRYARNLLRFPETGQLETELVRHGLIPDGYVAAPTKGPTPVLPHELLENRGRLLRFNPSCSLRHCEQAPLLYRLADLAGPALADLVIEERWPALEQVDLGSGPRAVATSVGGIPVQFNVAAGEAPNSFDREHHDRLREGVERARDAPHEVLIHAGKRIYTLQIRNLGEWYDLETLIGGLNTILAERKSQIRYVTLAPRCIPCAQVLAGPRDGLIAAAFDGLIEVVDPFRELWTLRNFDPLMLEHGERADSPGR